LELLTGLGGLVTLGALFFVGRPLDGTFALLAGAACLAWGLVVLSLPWDLHFRARAVLAELERSRARGLATAVDPAVIRGIARRTLGVALGAHAASALAVVGLAAWLDWPAGNGVAVAYLVSATFRPAGAWAMHLRDQLGRAMVEATHPRDDVLALRARLEALEHRAEEARRELEGLQQARSAADERLRAEAARLDLQVDRLGRQLESSVARLTDDRELLAGLRAFLRMVRET
jgi:hypothetical protein